MRAIRLAMERVERMVVVVVGWMWVWIGFQGSTLVD
jgi:hypothetical protein